jgi:hypothetical protein
MTNFAELKARREQEAKAKREAKAKAAPKRNMINNAGLIRSRHALMKRKLTDAEAKTVTAAFKQRRNTTAYDLVREEEIAKREADVAGGEALQAQADTRNTPLALAGAPAMPIQAPPGEDKDHWLAKEREADIERRLSLEDIGLGLPEDVARTYRLLVALSQPRKLGQGELGWRFTSLSEAGANPRRVLGLEEPMEPLGGYNLTNRQASQPTIEQRLEASRLLERHVAELEACGLLRRAGAFFEVSLAGVP